MVQHNTFGAAIVVTVDEAGTYRAKEAGRFVSRNFNQFLVSRDLAEVSCLQTILNDFPAGPHKPVRLALRERHKVKTMTVQQAPKQLPGKSEGKAFKKVE